LAERSACEIPQNTPFHISAFRKVHRPQFIALVLSGI